MNVPKIEGVDFGSNCRLGVCFLCLIWFWISVYFTLVFSACYNWWISLLVWLPSSFFFFFLFCLFVGVCVYVSSCDFVCLALLLPFALGFCLFFFMFVCLFSFYECVCVSFFVWHGLFSFALTICFGVLSVHYFFLFLWAMRLAVS